MITALGEFEASEKLREASDVLPRNPAAMTLRTLATTPEIGAEQNATTIFPVSQDSMTAPSLSPGLMAQTVELALAQQHGSK